MKKIALVLCMAVLALSCNKEPKPGSPDGPDETVPAWEDTDNGWLVNALAGAYATWEETNKLPLTVNWMGVDTYVSEYVCAGIVLVLNMVDHPKQWMIGSLEYPAATFGLTSDDPFLPQEVPFTAFVELLRDQYRSMTERGEVMLNMQIPGYASNLSTKGLAVMLCRACAAYADKGAFPGNINTWESSYLHPTANCAIDAAEVKTARDAAWKKAGVTEASSVRDKATAIFNYARDEWEWKDYMNTRKGAVGTITEKEGNCCDLSHAVVAMSRLSGIPARYFHAQCHYSSGYIGHVVSQLFVDGAWEMADASNNSNTLGKVTFTDYYSLHYYEELPF